MKSVHGLFAVVVVLLASGCAHNVQPAMAPSAEVQPLPRKCEGPSCEDNFDKAGNYVARGSRWVWDETKQGWQYVTSEEMQKKYSDAWQATKDAAQRAYDSAHQTYEEHK